MARHIHLIGAGGVGMAGIACLLKNRGHFVSGCDCSSSPRTKWLEENGIPVTQGHSPSHLEGIDELVVTPAVPTTNPELSAASAKGIRIVSRGEVLARLVDEADGIAVCGTHGKTTTSTFTMRLLRSLGEDPSWCIGGETGSQPVAGVGKGPLVVEADESDGTLSLYHPSIMVLTSVDFDHLEHFSSKEEYFGCYRTAMQNTRKYLIVCADHHQAISLASEADRSRLVTFGTRDDADISDKDWPELHDIVRGHHNILNVLAAIAVATVRGHSRADIAAVLPGAISELPNRRFERVWPPSEAVAGDTPFLAYTDYAHHPAELKCAVEMAREMPISRLRVIFQPHRYSRTKALLDEFPAAFHLADEVVLAPVYPAFEEPVPGGDIADLYRAFRKASGPHVILARSVTEAWRHVFLTRKPGDLALLAGAGDIVDIIPQLQRDLAESIRGRTNDAVPLPLAQFSFFRTGGVTMGGGERLIVGMGSNTWFSDCATDVEIVRAPSDPIVSDSSLIPAGITGASILRDNPELSFMAGIPGTVGGWTKMNAGAFGDSFGNHIEYVIADGTKLNHDECGFEYRSSAIRGMIEAVALKKAGSTPERGMNEFLARRKAFPPRTCGSVFKNPSLEIPAGRLLDEAGVKGMSVGGAKVWDEHANVIVAEEGCTSSDILALARLMARAAYCHSGVKLQPEIRGLEVWP